MILWVGTANNNNYIMAFETPKTLGSSVTVTAYKAIETSGIKN